MEILRRIILAITLNPKLQEVWKCLQLRPCEIDKDVVVPDFLFHSSYAEFHELVKISRSNLFKFPKGERGSENIGNVSQGEVSQVW